MGFCRLGLCLLLCSHTLFADMYWSHIAGTDAVQLTKLSTEQHNLLSTHLNLTEEETSLWLDKLPQILNNLSCDTLDAQSQRLPDPIDASYKLISYGGVLKFVSDDSSKATVWWIPWSLLPSIAQLKIDVADVTAQFHQPLVVSEHQLQQNQPPILVSGSIKTSVYYALRLATLEQPELLWQVSSTDTDFKDLSGAMAQPVLLPGQESTAALSLLLPNTGASEPRILIYKVDLLKGTLLASLNNAQKISDLSGALDLFDQNRDSIPDSLVFSTKAGLVWQAQFEGNQFYNIKPIADLSGLQIQDIQFIRMLYAAVPVVGSGSDFHSRRSQWLVMLSALQQQQSVFVMLKKQESLTPLSSDLVDRTQTVAPALTVLTEQQWQQILQKSGWYARLAGRLTQTPSVVAGVIYMTVLNPDPEQYCRIKADSSALIAMHLHHGAAVYRQQVFPLDLAAGALTVKVNTEGGFALIEQSSQRVLIEEMLEISPDCIHCSNAIERRNFPRWQLMGTYHSEEGAYE